MIPGSTLIGLALRQETRARGVLFQRRETQRDYYRVLVVSRPFPFGREREEREKIRYFLAGVDGPL